MDRDLKVIFVIPNGTDIDNCSENILLAYKSCTEQEIESDFLEENECRNIQPSKKDIYIFEKFEGTAFEHLKKSNKTLIIGTRCLMNCLLEGIEIPEVDSPVFTNALRGIVFSTTSFPKEKKEEIVQKCQYMGAFYSSSLRSSVTHLIVHRVLSNKYEIAVKSGVKVMTEEWVDKIWNESLKRNIHGDDSEFSIFKCPIFHNLVFTSSYLKKAEKESLKNIIEKNGGTLTGLLERGTTDIVILNEARGDKLKYASQWNIPCLTTDWIKHSIQNGYPQNIDKYNIQIKATSSTPKKNITQQQEPNFSISTIIGSDENHINETIASSLSTSSMKRQNIQMPPPEMPQSSIKKVKVNVKEILSNINLREVKKIGTFLDGCKVYLLGFIVDHKEKLNKILNHGGATRFNDLTSSVTHVLVDIERLKKSDENLLKELSHRPHIVTVQWLADSVKLKHPAVEDDYNIYGSSSSSPPSHRKNIEENINPCEASPLSKKGHKFLQSQNSKDELINFNSSESSSKRVNRKLMDELNFAEEISKIISNEETDLSEFYGVKEEKNDSSFSTKSEPKTPNVPLKDQQIKRNITHSSTLDRGYSSTTDHHDPQILTNLFENLTFVLIGIHYSFENEVEGIISNSGGKIVTSGYKGIIDYAVLPLELCEVRPKVKNIVNFFWVEQCFDMQHLVDIEYYHKPILISEDKPLRDCVLAITSFTGKERQFIIDIATFLGACPTEQFAKNDVPSKNIRKATHLISKDKSTQKYKAAVKWGVPVVTYKWLIACARNNKRMPDSQFGFDQLDETESQNNESLHNIEEIPNANLTTSPAKQENSNYSSISTHSHVSNKNLNSIKICVNGAAEVTSPQNQSEEDSPDLSQSPSLLKNHSPSPPSSPKGPNDQSPNKSPEKVEVDTLDKDLIVNKHLSRLLVSSKTPSTSTPERNKRTFSENEKDSNYLPKYNQRIYESEEESPIQVPRLSSIKESYDKFTNNRISESPSIWFKNQAAGLASPHPAGSAKTPDTPYGRFLYPQPSPDTRKRFKRYIDQIPSMPTDLTHNMKSTPNNKRRQSTPISELKKKIWSKFGADWQNSTDENDISRNQNIQNEEKSEDCDKNSEALSSENSKSPNKENDKNCAQPALSTQSQEVFNQLVHLNDILTTPTTKQDSINTRLKRSEIEEEMPSPSNDENLLLVETEPQVPIAWEDPASNDLILKIKNRNSERQSLTKVNIQLYKFSISGDKVLSDIVLTLGGTVSESSTFDNSISHMVVRSINRTERIMAAIASGKWLLNPYYLMASKDANKFIDEELYEWGNPKNKENEKLDGSSLSVARAAYRWRSQLNTTKETGAFAGMRAFVHTSKTRVESFQRLIMAGGGEIIKAISPSSNNLSGLTHFIVEMKYVKESTIPFALLANKKIPCLHPSYLSNLLIQNPSPKIEEHYVEEYKNFIKSKCY